MSAGPGSRFGVVADVHANLQALERVVDFLDAEEVDAIWCLGDVVGYGGDPSACVAIVRERCAATVRGNHDAAVVDPSLRATFNAHARKAVERHAEILGDEEKAWLASLPGTIGKDRFALGHGGFVDPASYSYVTSTRIAAAELDAIEVPLGLIGHTHVPVAWRRADDGRTEPRPVRGREVSLPVGDGARWLVNPGAVGQPRDRDSRASCGVLDLEAGTLRIVRLEYDIEGASEAIRRAGLPSFEAERLFRGM